MMVAVAEVIPLAKKAKIDLKDFGTYVLLLECPKRSILARTSGWLTPAAKPASSQESCKTPIESRPLLVLPRAGLGAALLLEQIKRLPHEGWFSFLVKTVIPSILNLRFI
jgi:hypothetical protein